jgi:hypothetical protein
MLPDNGAASGSARGGSSCRRMEADEGKIISHGDEERWSHSGGFLFQKIGAEYS